MRSTHDCNCTSPHIDCWSSRCRHDAVNVFRQQRDELQVKCDELLSALKEIVETQNKTVNYLSWLAREALAKAMGQV